MVITYQGMQSFRVQFGDTVIAFDPISKDSKLKSGSFGADIALISLNHPDMNGVEQASRGERRAFIINGPGEYEVGGVFVKASGSISKYGSPSTDLGSATRINTIYNVNLEGMNLCFLGALGNAEVSSEAKSSIENVDILFVPISGEGVLNPSEAYKFAVSLEPSVIIPMNFDEKSLRAFLKEGGEAAGKPIDKLTIKKKDLEGKEGEIIMLEAQ